VLHKLQVFVELLHDGVCGAEFVKQSQTPPKFTTALVIFTAMVIFLFSKNMR
jgi:hypothetical protein